MKSFILVFLPISLISCAGKSNFVIIEIENDPNHIPFERFNYGVTSNIGSKNISIGHETLTSDYGGRTQVVSHVDIKKVDNVIVKVAVPENQGSAIISRSSKSSLEFQHRMTDAQPWISQHLERPQ